MRLFWPDGSTDMQHDRLWSKLDIDLKSNFEFDLLRSCYIYFDSSQRDKNDDTNIFSVRMILHRLLAEKCFDLKQHFFIFDVRWSPNY